MFTLCEMLGVPEADRPKIIEWMKLLEMAQVIAATQASGSCKLVEVKAAQVRGPNCEAAQAS